MNPLLKATGLTSWQLAMEASLTQHIIYENFAQNRYGLVQNMIYLETNSYEASVQNPLCMLL